MSRVSITEQALAETNKALAQQLEQTMKELAKQNKRVQHLVAAIATSPSNSVATTPQTAPAAAPGMPAIDTSAKRSLDVEYEVENRYIQSSQKPTYNFRQMDGSHKSA